MKISFIITISLIAFIASPYISVYNLYSALINGDVQEINDRIDFPKLRSSMKDLVKAKMLYNIKNRVDNSTENNKSISVLEAAMAIVFGPPVIDEIVDFCLTPPALAGFLSNPDKFIDNIEGNKNNINKCINNLNIYSFRYAFFTSPTNFITITENGLRLNFEFKRMGWKLTSISFKNIEDY